MKLKINVLTIILLSLGLLSCEKQELTSDPIEIPLSIIDCWTEIEDTTVLQFSGTNYAFCFLNETQFTLELESWTDIVSDTNSPSSWIEYIKGTYVFTGESLEISGSYMDSEFENFVTNRLGETEFAKNFKVKVVSETEMILDNDDVNPYRGIRLVH